MEEDEELMERGQESIRPRGGEGVKMQPSQPLWKIVRKVFKKLKPELPYDPAVPFLGIYPDKNIIQKDTRSLCSQRHCPY